MSMNENRAHVIPLPPGSKNAHLTALDTRGYAHPPYDSKTTQPPSPVSASRWSQLRGHLATVGWFLLAWCLLGLFWEAAAYFEWVNRRILPPPSETLPYLLSGPAPVGIGSQRTSYLGAILDTLGRVGMGFVAGMMAAIALGALISRFRIMRRLAFPLVQTIAPISPVAWVPFAIAIVGIGGPAAVFVVFMAIFGSMTVSVVAAIDSTPREYLMVARNLGTRGLRLWTRVILPSAAPNLMVMARMSFFAAWMAVLAGEMAGINSGLGYLIMLGQQMYNMKLVMVGIITIGALGFAIDRLLLLAQRKLVWWETRP
jgi:NitT/TauT family transport system permease protein